MFIRVHLWFKLSLSKCREWLQRFTRRADALIVPHIWSGQAAEPVRIAGNNGRLILDRAAQKIANVRKDAFAGSVDWLTE